MNIQKIVNEKLEQMATDRTIETAIEKGIESTILKCVDDAVTGYQFKRDISEKIQKEVNGAIAEVDFTSYNAFIVQTIMSMLNETMQDDIRQRVETALNGIFVSQRKELKLSEIFTAYRDMLCSNEDERDKYDRQRFHATMEESEHGWFDISLHPEQIRETGWRAKQNADIGFVLHKKYKQDGMGWISSLYLDGVSLDSKLKIGHLNEVELMLLQAQYNETPVVIDIEDEDDIDNSYDIDF